MKISNIISNKFVKTTMVALPLLCVTTNINAQNKLKKDEFVKSEKVVNLEPHIGLDDMSPCLRLADKEVYPAIVIDLKDKNLYHYNLNTYIEDIYSLEKQNINSKKFKGLNIVRKIVKNKNDKTFIVLEELNVVTGKPVPDSLKIIAAESEHLSKNKNSIQLESQVFENILTNLEEEQYIWIK